MKIPSEKPVEVKPRELTCDAARLRTGAPTKPTSETASQPKP